MDVAPKPAVRCPACGGEIAPAHLFCPSCGAPVGPLSALPTRTVDSPTTPAADVTAPMMSAPVGRLMSSGPIPTGGFTPGMVLASRYRVIGLLGRGGMGEVYRADDLKLGQPVALKFLPKGFAADPVRRERFYAEVRIARQVSHPNVCRVYDVSELDGLHYLTMEYIDGEDLASLLKHIGSLHGTKALDVARQLCAGLAAAHNKGALHRDVKPANVMIDGRGHVRITDFGLAVAAGDDAAAADVAGTPAYMAPEQFAGKGASAQSDIYALGLVLYELYTGRRAFDASSLAELRAKKEHESLPAPSDIARDIDPIVERVILRCIEKEPRQRPASVVQVAAALPGGDPLAAALAAGETPSPEMVAASGSTEGFHPRTAWACLAFILLGIGAFVWLSPRADLIRRVPVDLAPEVLANKARDILKSIGYSESPIDHASGFGSRTQSSGALTTRALAARWDNPPALAIQFWYRQSPRFLEPSGPGANHSSGVPGGVNAAVPPMLPGESLVWLDSRRYLTGFRVVPSDEAPTSAATGPLDWTALFKAAGIDPARCTPVDPAWTPPTFADARAAWTGVLPDRPDLALRIEAAAYRGKPVSWRMTVPPWDEDDPATRIAASSPASTTSFQQTSNLLWLVLLMACLVGGALLARRNLRTGRIDRNGATRLASTSLVLTTIAWVLGEHHTPSLGEFSRFTAFAGSALFTAAWLLLLYAAIEPAVRRRWPDSLVGWNRLLAGRFKDALLGRDLLVGCVSGMVWALLNHLMFLTGVSQPNEGFYLTTLYLLSGLHAVVAGVAGLVVFCVIWGFSELLFQVLFRVVFKNVWIAAVVQVTCSAVVFAIDAEPSLVLWMILAGMNISIVFTLVRYGLVACVAQFLITNLLIGFPITGQLSGWYSGVGFAGVGLVLAIALYAFRTALGGQTPLGRASLEG